MSNNKTHQELMDEAYKLWEENKDWSKFKFITSLDPKHQVAVVLGNLNYQVGTRFFCLFNRRLTIFQNGGFLQWEENGYAEDHINFLREIKKDLEKREGFNQLKLALDYTFEAIDIMNEPEEEDEDDEFSSRVVRLDRLDTDFYDLNSLPEEMQAYLDLQ